MSWMDRAREALAMAAQARTTLAQVADAVKDSRTGLATTDEAELKRLLAEEAQESRAAHDSLDAAIKASGG